MNAGQPTPTKEVWTSGTSLHRSHAGVDLQKVFERMESCGSSAIDAKHLCSELLNRGNSPSSLVD